MPGPALPPAAQLPPVPAMRCGARERGVLGPAHGGREQPSPHCAGGGRGAGLGSGPDPVLVPPSAPAAPTAPGRTGAGAAPWPDAHLGLSPRSQSRLGSARPRPGQRQLMGVTWGSGSGSGPGARGPGADGAGRQQRWGRSPPRPSSSSSSPASPAQPGLSPALKHSPPGPRPGRPGHCAPSPGGTWVDAGLQVRAPNPPAAMA